MRAWGSRSREVPLIVRVAILTGCNSRQVAADNASIEASIAAGQQIATTKNDAWRKRIIAGEAGADGGKKR